MKLPAFLVSFQTEEHVLSIDKSEITGENAFTGVLCQIRDNHESSKDEKTSFYVFLQIGYQSFNP